MDEAKLFFQSEFYTYFALHEHVICTVTFGLYFYASVTK